MSWRLPGGDAPGWAGCDALHGVPRVAHGFGTRGSGDRPSIQLRQVHGRTVHLVGSAGLPEGSEGDGMAATAEDRPRLPLAVRCADCVPVLIAEREGRAVAAVHSGWRGTAAAVATRAVEMLAGIGADPERLVVALGPAIGPCCYRVGPEVLRAVEGVSAVAAGRLDLRAALRGQLEAAGVPGGSIHTAPWCTRCEEKSFFSYRREGPGGGRQLAWIGWEGVP